MRLDHPIAFRAIVGGNSDRRCPLIQFLAAIPVMILRPVFVLPGPGGHLFSCSLCSSFWMEAPLAQWQSSRLVNGRPPVRSRARSTRLPLASAQWRAVHRSPPAARHGCNLTARLAKWPRHRSHTPTLPGSSPGAGTTCNVNSRCQTRKSDARHLSPDAPAAWRPSACPTRRRRAVQLRDGAPIWSVVSGQRKAGITAWFATTTHHSPSTSCGSMAEHPADNGETTDRNRAGGPTHRSTNRPQHQPIANPRSATSPSTGLAPALRQAPSRQDPERSSPCGRAAGF